MVGRGLGSYQFNFMSETTPTTVTTPRSSLSLMDWPMGAEFGQLLAARLSLMIATCGDSRWSLSEKGLPARRFSRRVEKKSGLMICRSPLGASMERRELRPGISNVTRGESTLLAGRFVAKAADSTCGRDFVCCKALS